MPMAKGGGALRTALTDSEVTGKLRWRCRVEQTLWPLTLSAPPAMLPSNHTGCCRYPPLPLRDLCCAYSSSHLGDSLGGRPGEATLKAVETREKLALDTDTMTMYDWMASAFKVHCLLPSLL